MYQTLITKKSSIFEYINHGENFYYHALNLDSVQNSANVQSENKTVLKFSLRMSAETPVEVEQLKFFTYS